MGVSRDLTEMMKMFQDWIMIMVVQFGKCIKAAESHTYILKISEFHM